MRFAVLGLIAAFPFAALACKRGNAALVSDAGETNAAAIDAGSTIVAASASSSAPLPRVVSLFDEKSGLMKETTPAAPRTWTGSYKCRARLTLTQGDKTVIGRMNVAPDDTSLVCTISGETCTGTETETKHPKTGGAPPPRTRKVTLRRDSYGSIHYSVEGGAAATCPKL